MNKPEYQDFPDGTRVRFTDEAREAMQKHPGFTPLPTPGNGHDAVYTIDNTDDSLHDVILRETGERWGTYWLQEVLDLDEARDLDGSAEVDPDIAVLEEFFERDLPISFNLARGRKPIPQSLDQLRDASPDVDDSLGSLDEEEPR